jgi:hypothetical protein
MEGLRAFSIEGHEKQGCRNEGQSHVPMTGPSIGSNTPGWGGGNLPRGREFESSAKPRLTMGDSVHVW